MTTAQHDTDRAVSLLETLLRLAPPQAGPSTDTPQVTYQPGPAPRVRLDATEGRADWPASDELVAHLEVLQHVGALAARVRSEIVTGQHRDREQRVARERAERAAAHQNADAAFYGLREGAKGWTLRAQDTHRVDGAHVHVIPSEATARGHIAELAVHVENLHVATIAVDADGRVSTVGAFAHSRLPEHLSRTERDALVALRAWSTYESPAASASVLEHVITVVEFFPRIRPFLEAFGEARTEEQRRIAERAETEAQWRRLSRHRDRLPNKKLTEWMRSVSHIDYTADGLAIGGWRVVAEHVVGHTRPRALEGGRRGRRGSGGSPVGLSEVLFAVRLVHTEVRGGRSRFSKFYDYQVESLRAALEDHDVVIRVPEDRGAVFVATNKPEYVTELEAAAAEWVLTGAGVDD